MQKPSAIAGSAIFFLVAPGMVAGVLPWLVLGGYGHQLSAPAASWLGFLLVAVAIGVLVHCFAAFALEGGGTPAPVAPTDRLVVGGAYRYVRNPMYVTVLSIIAGQALIFGSWVLVFYGVLAGLLMASFVRLYEEPTLATRYGAQYEIYRRAVPGWVPRLTPWRGE